MTCAGRDIAAARSERLNALVVMRGLKAKTPPLLPPVCPDERGRRQIVWSRRIGSRTIAIATPKCDLMISRNRAEQDRCYLQSGGDVLPVAWLKFADIHYLLREWLDSVPD